MKEKPPRVQRQCPVGFSEGEVTFSGDVISSVLFGSCRGGSCRLLGAGTLRANAVVVSSTARRKGIVIVAERTFFLFSFEIAESDEWIYRVTNYPACLPSGGARSSKMRMRHMTAHEGWVDARNGRLSLTLSFLRSDWGMCKECGVHYVTCRLASAGRKQLSVVVEEREMGISVKKNLCVGSDLGGAREE